VTGVRLGLWMNLLVGTLLLAVGIVEGLWWLTLAAAAGLFFLVPMTLQARRARDDDREGEHER
jgi:uncharacterized membrane protein YhaH (DUF805 family)